MEPGVLFPPAILRSEIKGAGLNGNAAIREGKSRAREGAMRRVPLVHRFATMQKASLQRPERQLDGYEKFVLAK